MEYLNKIELRGVVGRAEVSTYGNRKACRFSLCTERTYNDKDGNQIVDVQWFNCIVWQQPYPQMESVETIEKGANVGVSGRIRNYKFTAQDGTERYGYEVVVTDFNVIAPPVQR